MEQIDAIKLENWVDEAVMSFVVDMKYKLRMNNHKGHWREYSLAYLLQRLDGEIGELKEASKLWSSSSSVDQRQLLAIVHECADVANFALMIADNAKRTMRSISGRES